MNWRDFINSFRVPTRFYPQSLGTIIRTDLIPQFRRIFSCGEIDSVYGAIFHACEFVVELLEEAGLALPWQCFCGVRTIL